MSTAKEKVGRNSLTESGTDNVLKGALCPLFSFALLYYILCFYGKPTTIFGTLAVWGSGVRIPYAPPIGFFHGSPYSSRGLGFFFYAFNCSNVMVNKSSSR